MLKLKSIIKKHLPWFILLAVFLGCCVAGTIFAVTMFSPSGHDYSKEDTSEEAQAEEEKTGTYYVYGGAYGLPLCDAPTSYAKITTVIPDKSEVQILSSKVRGYYKVQYKTREGYVKSRYLLKYGKNASKKTKQKLLDEYPLYYVIAKEETIPLYKKRNESSKVAAEIPSGYRVRILEKARDGYYRVAYKNKVGYIQSQYLTQSVKTAQS